jgi:hypothetical protein
VRRANLLNTELCFSSAFFIMTTGQPKPSSVAIAALNVDADHGVIQVNDALVDTGGSKNLASRHLLKNIKLAKSYGNEPIRMVTVNGLSHLTTTTRANYTQQMKTELR